MLSRWKIASPLHFQQYNHFKYYKICFCARMLVLECKERAFTEKVNSRCFCWFPAAKLVDQNCAPIWRLLTKLCKGAETFRQITQKNAGQKDLRLGQIVYVLVFYNISFSWLLLPDVFQFIFLLCDSENDLKSFAFTTQHVVVEFSERTSDSTEPKTFKKVSHNKTHRNTHDKRLNWSARWNRCAVLWCGRDLWVETAHRTGGPGVVCVTQGHPTRI